MGLSFGFCEMESCSKGKKSSSSSSSSRSSSRPSRKGSAEVSQKSPMLPSRSEGKSSSELSNVRSSEVSELPQGVGEVRKKRKNSPSDLRLATHVLCETQVEGPGPKSLVRVYAPNSDFTGGDFPNLRESFPATFGSLTADRTGVADTGSNPSGHVTLNSTSKSASAQGQCAQTIQLAKAVYDTCPSQKDNSAPSTATATSASLDARGKDGQTAETLEVMRNITSMLSTLVQRFPSMSEASDTKGREQVECVDRGRLPLPSSGGYASSMATMQKDQVSWQVPYSQAHSAVVASAPSNTGISEVEAKQNFGFPLSSLVEEDNRDQRPMVWSRESADEHAHEFRSPYSMKRKHRDSVSSEDSEDDGSSVHTVLGMSQETSRSFVPNSWSRVVGSVSQLVPGLVESVPVQQSSGSRFSNAIAQQKDPRPAVKSCLLPSQTVSEQLAFGLKAFSGSFRSPVVDEAKAEFLSSPHALRVGKFPSYRPKLFAVPGEILKELPVPTLEVSGLSHLETRLFNTGQASSRSADSLQQVERRSADALAWNSISDSLVGALDQGIFVEDEEGNVDFKDDVNPEDVSNVVKALKDSVQKQSALLADIFLYSHVSRRDKFLSSASNRLAPFAPAMRSAPISTKSLFGASSSLVENEVKEQSQANAFSALAECSTFRSNNFRSSSGRGRSSRSQFRSRSASYDAKNRSDSFHPSRAIQQASGRGSRSRGRAKRSAFGSHFRGATQFAPRK